MAHRPSSWREAPNVDGEPPRSGPRPRVGAAGPARPANAGRSARTIVDTILQSSVVELFESHGIAVAPSRATPVGQLQSHHDSVAMIGFDGPTFSGLLTLSMPAGLLALRASGSATAWAEELVNQLHGRVKNRLAVFQVRLEPRLPRTMSSVTLERLHRRTGGEMLYVFRSMQGEILVTLDAPVHEALLSYSGSTEVAREGDVILF